ncbi:MAG: hypothetical protein H8E44_33345 [Planctomycetes bacterium]|nr:hypothetical protein [Planctomycetota bacterium]MBL7037372.1 hypothetical protein [Pirellulaceae bacterium]
MNCGPRTFGIATQSGLFGEESPNWLVDKYRGMVYIFFHARACLKCPHISFNPKPEAMAGDACGPSILFPAIASGFGLNDGPRNQRHYNLDLRK